MRKMIREYDDNELKKLLEQYRQRLENVCFSAPEQRRLEELNPEEDILEIVKFLMDSSVELNHIFEQCPDSIYVTDKDGMTQRANKAFEETTDIMRHEVLGKDVRTIEKEGFFKPSVCALIMKEQRKISLLQSGRKGTDVVTGVPILNERGEMYKIVTNARALDEINEITSYIEQSVMEEEVEDEYIVAESPAMRNVLEIARQVADVDSNVLITGESGVGKGVLARFLHTHSCRREGRFVQINCGAIPESLIESEIFGYESGAFTGASKNGKKGLIELADHGTLFLDEIGELHMMLQVKLLNFLQERKFTRVGGTKEIEVDVRIIAATNKNLMEMVSKGEFRDDLYYRLNVVPILIPPLRQRTEDIYPAACYFARKFREKYNKKFVFSDEFLETLLHYDWMGNVRELENYMERMVVMSGAEGTAKLLCNELELESVGDSDVNQLNLSERLEKYEAELVKAAYDKEPNTYKVAQLLGISQPSASRKINKYIKNSEK